MKKVLYILMMTFIFIGCDKTANKSSSNETVSLFHEDTTQVLKSINNPIPKELYTLPSISN